MNDTEWRRRNNLMHMELLKDENQPKNENDNDIQKRHKTNYDLFIKKLSIYSEIPEKIISEKIDFDFFKVLFGIHDFDDPAFQEFAVMKCTILLHGGNNENNL
jgi:hypothetical protein